MAKKSTTQATGTAQQATQKKTVTVKGFEWIKGARTTDSTLATLHSTYNTLHGYLKAAADEKDSKQARNLLETVKAPSYVYNQTEDKGRRSVTAVMSYKPATKSAPESLQLKKNYQALIISLKDTSKAVAVMSNIVTTLDAEKCDNADSGYLYRDNANFTQWIAERRIGENLVSTFVARIVKKYQTAIDTMLIGLESWKGNMPTVEGYKVSILEPVANAAD